MKILFQTIYKYNIKFILKNEFVEEENKKYTRNYLIDNGIIIIEFEVDKKLKDNSYFEE